MRCNDSVHYYRLHCQSWHEGGGMASFLKRYSKNGGIRRCDCRLQHFIVKEIVRNVTKMFGR